MTSAKTSILLAVIALLATLDTLLRQPQGNVCHLTQPTVIKLIPKRKLALNASKATSLILHQSAEKLTLFAKHLTSLQEYVKHATKGTFLMQVRDVSLHPLLLPQLFKTVSAMT